MLLAATPEVSPLLCTIEDVQSRWTPRPIPGVRVAKGQTFEVHRKGALHVSPRYVIDSRLSVLADDLIAPQGSVGADGAIIYRWSLCWPMTCSRSATESGVWSRWGHHLPLVIPGLDRPCRHRRQPAGP